MLVIYPESVILSDEFNYLTNMCFNSVPGDIFIYLPVDICMDLPVSALASWTGHQKMRL